MTILILGNADDDHAAHMRDHLSTLGADVEFLDSSRFPAELRISLSVAVGLLSGALTATAEMNSFALVVAQEAEMSTATASNASPASAASTTPWSSSRSSA